MNSLKKNIFEHKTAFILSFLVAIVIVLPQVYFRIDHPDFYQKTESQAIELLPDSPWSARVSALKEDLTGFSNIYYKEGAEDPYLFQPLGSLIVASLGNFFDLDINNTLLLSRIILTIFVFLFIYFFIYSFSREKLSAISGASIIILAESALSFYGFKQIFSGISPEDFLRMSRPVNPAMIYIFFFSFLLVFWFFYKKQDTRLGILASFLLGLNFYNYLYSWTYLYAFGLILSIILITQKNIVKAKNIILVFLGGVVVAIPYLINLYASTIHPNYQEASIRFGIVLTHKPLFVGFLVLASLILFLWFFPREDKQKYYFGLALLLAPFITLNQQIITGKVLQPAHYHWFFHKPIALIILLIIVFYLLSLKINDIWGKILAGLIIVSCFSVGVFVQLDSYFYGTNDGGQVAIDRQEYGPVVYWLNQNTNKSDVVFANNEISHIVSIYTPLPVFYHRAGMYSMAATKERLTDSVFAFYRLQKVGKEDSQKIFFSDKEFISSNIYGMHYREKLGSYDAIPDEKIFEILSLYRQDLNKTDHEWMKDLFNKYGIKYLIWDAKKDLLWSPQRFSFLEERAKFGNISIYIYKAK